MSEENKLFLDEEEDNINLKETIENNENSQNNNNIKENDIIIEDLININENDILKNEKENFENDIIIKNSINLEIDILNNKNNQSIGIPENLIPLIYHTIDSLTYKALNGENLPNISLNTQNSIISDLRKYLDLSVDRNLISEALYIQQIIDNIRLDKSNIKSSTEKELILIDQKILETNLEIEERLNFWKTQENMIEKELEMAFQDLINQKEQAISQLDSEWQSPKKQQHYSKPSPQLLNLREMAKKMIKSKRFEDVTKISKMISEKEKIEILEKTERMKNDYLIADQRIQEKFESEKLVLIRIKESKLNSVIRTKDNNLRPLKQRLENLQKSKELILKNKKEIIKIKDLKTSRDSPKINSSQLPSIIGTPKLSLPNIIPIRRDLSKTQLIKLKSSKNLWHLETIKF